MSCDRLTGFYFLTKIVTLLAFVLSSVLIPFLFLLLYIWKSIVTYWAIILHGDVSPMKFLDYVVGVLIDIDIEDYKSRHFNGNIGITCKLRGNINGHAFFEAFEKNVIQIDYNKDISSSHKHIRFHQSIYRFGGYWFFKTFRNKLKYEDHVTCTTLTNNISYEEVICNWLKVRYDVKKCPLWGILLIYREESQDTIFAFKIHHILADGFSLVHILDLLTNTRNRSRQKELQSTRWKNFLILAKSSFSFFEYLIKTAVSVDQSPIYRLKTDDDIFLTYLTFPTSVIKDIRQKFKVRFQSVMLYLIVKYVNSLINKTVNDESIPDKIAIVNSLPWRNHPLNELCNRYTIAPFVFKITNKSNPNQESVTNTNKIFEDFHHRYYDRATYHAMKLMAVLPIEVSGVVQSKFHQKQTAFYGHVVSTEKHSKIFDIECQDINFFLVPNKQKLISVTGVTISNEVKLAIIGPKSLFSSQEQADKYAKDNFLRHIANIIAHPQMFE